MIDTFRTTNGEAKPECLDTEIEDLQSQIKKIQQISKLKTNLARLKAVAGKIDDPVVNIITDAVCSSFKVRRTQVFTRRRIPQVLWARHSIFYFLHKFGSLTHQEIGDLFGRDHSAVTYSCQAVRNRHDTEKQFATLLSAIEEKLTDQLSIF